MEMWDKAKKAFVETNYLRINMNNCYNYDIGGGEGGVDVADQLWLHNFFDH